MPKTEYIVVSRPLAPAVEDGMITEWLNAKATEGGWRVNSMALHQADGAASLVFLLERHTVKAT